MSEDKKWNLEAISRNIYINEIIFIGLITLCFIGDIIGSITNRGVVFYWLLMVPIFFIASYISQKVAVQTNERTNENFFKYEFIFWGSALISFFLVLLLWHAEAIKPENVGIILHIILAHTMFLTGSLLGARFYLIGIFLFLLAGLTITMSSMIALTFIIAIPIVILGLYYEKYFLFPSIRKKYDEVYEGKKQ